MAYLEDHIEIIAQNVFLAVVSDFSASFSKEERSGTYDPGKATEMFTRVLICPNIAVEVYKNGTLTVVYGTPNVDLTGELLFYPFRGLENGASSQFVVINFMELESDESLGI